MNYRDAWGKYTMAELQYFAAQAKELQRAIRDMTAMLQGREWAEHVSSDPDIQALECEITKLVEVPRG